MRHLLIPALVSAAAVSLTISTAQATDVLSQETSAHVLTITKGNTQKIVEIAAKGDIRGICDGCTIALENGQSVSAKVDDIVFLMDGKLSVYEP